MISDKHVMFGVTLGVFRGLIKIRVLCTCKVTLLVFADHSCQFVIIADHCNLPSWQLPSSSIIVHEFIYKVYVTGVLLFAQLNLHGILIWILKKFGTNFSLLLLFLLKT